jgi:hypothetical protein
MVGTPLVIVKNRDGGLTRRSLRASNRTRYLFHTQSSKGREELLTAAVERGPSEGARSGSKESSSRPCQSPFLDCRGKAVLA